MKPLARRALLFLIWPRVFTRIAAGLRIVGVLPKRVYSQIPPTRILVVNLTSNLGDVIMMLPVVDALRTALPDAAVDIVVEEPMGAPLRAIPWVRQVYAFERDTCQIRVLGSYLRVFRMLRFVRRELIDRAYDLVLLPRWGTDPSLSSYLALMTSAQRRCGHDPDEDVASEPVLPGMASLLTAVSHGGNGLAEAVREQLVLLSSGVIKTLDPKEEERRRVESVLHMGRSIDLSLCMKRLGMDPDHEFILLAPGASHPVRCWPAERFAALGQALHKATGLDVYAIGGPADRALGEQLQSLSAGIIRSLAGQTSILEAIQLSRSAKLLVTNDSGPAHVGGSVGTPTIVLSACPRTSREEHANSPSRVRPVGPCVRVLQPQAPGAGCVERCNAPKAHCICGISTDSVLQEALELLHRDGSGGIFLIERTTAAGAPTATQ